MQTIDATSTSSPKQSDSSVDFESRLPIPRNTGGGPIWIGFVLALAAVVCVAAVAHWSLGEFTEGADWVSHTHQVMERLQTLLGDVEYVEVLTRNYVIVGDERYRAQLGGMRAQIAADVASIAELSKTIRSRSKI